MRASAQSEVRENIPFIRETGHKRTNDPITKRGMDDMSAKQLAIELFIMAAIGLAFGFLGPFGTYSMPLAIKLSFWIGSILLGYAVFRPTLFVAAKLEEVSRINIWLSTAIAAALAAIPLALAIGLFFANQPQTSKLYAPELLGNKFGLLYLQCALIGIGIFLLMQLIFPNRARTMQSGNRPSQFSASSEIRPQEPEAENLEKAEAPPALLKRLPLGFPSPIYALGVEDHYVRVYAKNCTEMVLLRLRDAIAEMDGVDGMQVHRSWWVARAVISSSKRDGRNYKLVLHNDMEIPVSRSYAGRLKQANWL